jgi:hypothetical protein
MAGLKVCHLSVWSTPRVRWRPSRELERCLIVPASKSTLAETILREQYRRAVGVHPYLVVHRAAKASKGSLTIGAAAATDLSNPP